MMGAALAAAVRYRIARVQSWMQIGLLPLILLPLMQFICVDLGNAGIAGLAHQLALAIGFVLGLLPRLNGPVTVITSRPEAIDVDSVTVDDLNKQVVGVVYRVSPQFDDDKDFLVKKQDYLGHNTVPTYKLLGGKRPVAEAEGQIVPLNVMPVKLADEVYKKVLRAVVPMSIVIVLALSALSQALMSKYSSPLYPSIFVGTLVLGALILGATIYSARTILAWQRPDDAKGIAQLRSKKIGMIPGLWESD
jgi:hypothetical protein